MRRYQIGAGGAGEELEIECTFSQNIGMVNDRAMMHAKRAASRGTMLYRSRCISLLLCN